MSHLIDSWNLSRLVDMNSDISHLKGVELPPPLCYQLQAIVDAYRPHDPIPTHKDLDKDDRREKESHVSMKCIHDTLQAVRSSQDLTYLTQRRKYLEQYKGCRSYYALGYND